MTEDELDRALFALELEAPPADLHQRIMAATALRPASPFAEWERLLAAALIALIAALAAWTFLAVPGLLHRTGTDAVAAVRALGLFDRSTYAWLAIGLSSVWWISSLNFMPTPRPTVYNR